MSAARYLALSCLLLGCAERGDSASHARADAVASASQEMSGPSLFSRERLTPALALVRAKQPCKLLRLEIRPRELIVQAEDSHNPGGVVELHYRDGKVSEPEHATLRGKGQLADNLFELESVKLDAIAELTRVAVQRIDSESGSAEQVLVRRNLPESDEVRMRVYVTSPRQNGYLDADRNGQPL